MAQVDEVLAYEERAYTTAAHAVNEETSETLQRIRAEAAARSFFQSGLVNGRLASAELNRAERLIRIRLDLRKKTVGLCPELADERHLGQLLAEMEHTVDAICVAMAGKLRQWGYVDTEIRADSGREFEDDALRLKGMARQQIDLIAREVELGIIRGEDPRVVIDTSGGPAAINLGIVTGNVQAVLGTLNQVGSEELAKAIEQLAAEVRASDSLGEKQAEVLESLALIGQQAVRPPEEQSRSAARAMFRSIGQALGHIANLSQIWSAVGPIIAKHFGWPWPG